MKKQKDTSGPINEHRKCLQEYFAGRDLIQAAKDHFASEAREPKFDHKVIPGKKLIVELDVTIDGREETWWIGNIEPYGFDTFKDRENAWVFDVKHRAMLEKFMPEFEQEYDGGSPDDMIVTRAMRLVEIDVDATWEGAEHHEAELRHVAVEWGLYKLQETA